jgi:uncharacterized protein (TIGR00297 family)
MDFFTLNWKGTLLAILIAVLLVIFGFGFRDYGTFFVLMMLLFLVLSAIVTKAGSGRKRREGVYERLRGTNNVLANGLAPLFFAMLYWISTLLDHSTISYLAFVGFIAAVASITADKFSSEIGVLDGAPRAIIGFKKTRKGVSGSVTWLGLVAGLVGSVMVSSIVLRFGWSLSFPGYSNVFVLAFLSCSVAGFAGTVVDSVLGYFESRGIGTKHTTNFLSSLAGGMIGMLIYFLIVFVVL